MQNRWIQLGIVGKAHGLNGAFFVSGREEEFPEVVVVRIGASVEKAQDYKVKAIRWQNDRPVVQCEGIKSRTEAEAITHLKIWADRGELVIDEDEEFFYSDVIGKKIVDSEGKDFGEIVDMVNYGASDIAIVEDGKGRVAEIPFVDAYFNMDFDLDDEVLHMLVKADLFDEVWTSE